MPGMITLYIALGGFSLWFVYMICQVLYSTWLWIDDKEQRSLVPWPDGEIGWDLFILFWLSVGLFLAILAWKIAAPIAILFVCAFGMRWSVRFKKKVNTAIEKCKPNKKEVNGDKHIMGESAE